MQKEIAKRVEWSFIDMVGPTISVCAYSALDGIMCGLQLRFDFDSIRHDSVFRQRRVADSTQMRGFG